MEAGSLSTSLTLLDQLRAPGHTDAWNRFVQLYRPLLTAWAKRQGFQDADAADLAQEVLLKLMEELPQYTKGAGQSFRGWLYRVTANVCHDFRRRRSTRALPGAEGLSQVDDGPTTEFEEREYRQALVKSGLKLVAGEFTPQTLAAFEQLMMQNRSAAEVATELGMSKGAVYSAQSRVLKRLREIIDDFLD